MKELKKILCIALAIVMVFAFSACGSSGSDSETDNAVNEENMAENQEAEDVSGIDLSAGITRTDINETGEATVESDAFTVTLPDGNKWDYEVTESSDIVFYDKAARDGGFGGTLFTLAVLPEDDQTDEIMPAAVLAHVDGKKIVAIFPSDVQYDFEDEEAKAEYMALYDVVHTISDDASTSPLVLK